jgi:hypothetical protein
MIVIPVYATVICLGPNETPARSALTAINFSALSPPERCAIETQS